MKKLGLVMSLVLVFSLVLAACAPDNGNFNEGDLETTNVPELNETPPGEDLGDEPGDIEPTADAGLGDDDQAGEGVEGAAPDPARVSNLIGYDLESSDGDSLGTVNSLVVDRQSGQIFYALVDPEDDLEIVGDLVAIPWNTITLTDTADDAEDNLVFDEDTQLLVDSPAFTADELDVTGEAWDDEVYAYWSNEVAALPQTGAQAGEAGEGQMAGLVRLEDVTDHQLLNTQGEDIGDVEDMILSQQDGAIAYILAATGGLLDVGEDLIPVPFANLIFGSQDDEDAFVLNASEEELDNAPTINMDEFDPGTDNWDEEYRTFWADVPEADVEEDIDTGEAAPAQAVDAPTRVSEILGMNIETATGDDLGEIESLIVDRQSGQVHWALVDVNDGIDEDWGVENDTLVLPWSAFTVAGANLNTIDGEGEVADANTDAGEADADADSDEMVLVYGLNQEQWLAAPTIEDANELDLTADDWDADWRTYWSGEGVTIQEYEVDADASDDGNAVTTGAVRLSDVEDHNLVNADGENLGDIEDMLMDPTQGMINYVIWAAGGFLDIGEKLIPVPFEKMQWTLEEDEDSFVLPVNEDIVDQAPAFEDADAIPDTFSTGWDEEYQTFWQEIGDEDL